MYFVFFLVGGTWLVRHRPLHVDGEVLYDDGVAKGAFASAAAYLGVAPVALAVVAETRQPCGLRFDTTGHAAFAKRFVVSANAAWPEVALVLRATTVAPVELLGVVLRVPSAPILALCARLPPDLVYAVAQTDVPSHEALAARVVELVPTLLAAADATEFRAAVAAERAVAATACAWYQTGYGDGAPDAVSRLRQTPDAFAMLVGAMVDPQRALGAPTQQDKFFLDRAALLCLDEAPLARTVATTLFGDGGRAVSVQAWYDAVRACSLAVSSSAGRRFS